LTIKDKMHLLWELY